MDPIKLLKKYCCKNRQAYHALLSHGLQVAEKAINVADRAGIKIDRKFVKEASILHDIGVTQVNAGYIGIKNSTPYICHGYMGREILEREGLPLHALVCERHIGMGLTKEEIIEDNLPLPARDMVPLTIEEKLICFADKFFTKGISQEKNFRYVRRQIKQLGGDKLCRFDEMIKLFNYKER